MSIQIRHHVAHIQQPNPNDCWATAVAMVMGRHSLAGVEHVKNLARAQGVTPNPNGSLAPGDVPRVARAVHLVSHDFRVGRRFTLEFLQRVMGRSAVALFGGVNYPSQMTAIDHALALYQLVGDGSARHTMVYFVDPFNGRHIHFDFERFEGEIVVVDFILAQV